MVDLKKFENVAFELKFNQDNLIRTINRILRSHGATLFYDVYGFERTDKVPEWQTSSLLTVDCLKNGEVVDAQDVADGLKVSYLFASLDTTFISKAVDKIFAIALELNATVLNEGMQITKAEMLHFFDELTSELMNKYGEEPGSEVLSILIESMYHSL